MKKFGNSLLLRLGMRLSKVKPELATAKAAIKGGIMSEAKDMCRVNSIAGGRNEDKSGGFTLPEDTSDRER